MQEFQQVGDADSHYEPPAIEDLGTLADLTLGGGSTVADASGHSAGASGSIP